MDNMINIKCNWRHSSLEYQIKKLDTSMDLSRAAMFFRMLRVAEKEEDWEKIKGLLLTIKEIDEAPSFSNWQARYDDKSAEILEGVRRKILSDMKDNIKVLQNQYMMQLLQMCYLEHLKKEALAVRSDSQIRTEDVVDAPEVVKLLVELIILDKEADALDEIRNILIEWRNKR